MAYHRKRLLVLLSIIVSLAVPGLALAVLDVSLGSPPDSTVFNETGNVTFNCSASSDNYLKAISLYTDTGGSFSLNKTRYAGEFDLDSNTLMLCHFNGSLKGADGEQPGFTLGSLYYSDGRLHEGVFIDGNSGIAYVTNNNFDRDQGTVEFWLRPGDGMVNLSGKWVWSIADIDFNPFPVKNEFIIKIDSGNLIFSITDKDVNLHNITRNVSDWQANTTAHITITWDLDAPVSNTSRMELYVNGSISGNNYSDTDSDITLDGTPGSIGLGVNKSLIGMDSLMDELRISDIVRTWEEINSSARQGIKKSTSENITIEGIPDGTYLWNCLAQDNESNSNWSSSNLTFHVDTHTPPAVEGVNLTPSSEDDIDPGVNVSVAANVSDVSNVSHVMLQYKAPLAGIYTNDSMDYNQASGMWENGTIVTTPSDIGNWTYRFWSNDTNGNAGVSGTYTLPVEWDSSWTLVVINSSGSVSDSLGTTSGFKGTVQTLGTLIINNTGDSSLNFDLSSSLQIVDYNTTEPFDLASGENRHVEVNATMPETPSEYPLTINVTSSGGSPLFMEADAVVISYIGGPNINDTTDITSYPLLMNQSSSGVFIARSKNIGNETAINVWINWSFPQGWSNTSGNLTNFLGNISPQETVTTNVTAHADSSAHAGVVTVSILFSSNHTNGTDSKIMQLECSSSDGACGSGCTYLTDSDCDMPTGGGTSTGGSSTYAGTVEEPRMEISMPDRVDLTKGEQSNITIEVKNPVDGAVMNNVRLGTAGYPETLITAMPGFIEQIKSNQSKEFKLVINAPPYMEEKEYILTVSVLAEGVYSGGNKTLKSYSSIILALHGVVENLTLSALRGAEAAVKDMKNMNFTVSFVAPMLEDAWKAYYSLDFDKANELSGKITELKGKAFSVFGMITCTGNMVGEAERYGISVEETKKMQGLAGLAFQRGDYRRADERITAAITAYNLETKDILPLMKLLHTRWPVFLMLLLLAAVLYVTSVKKGRIKLAEKRLESVRSSKSALRRMEKGLQHDYFTRKMPKIDYLMRKAEYERKLSELETEEMRLVIRIGMLKGGDKMEALAREQALIKNRIKAIQHRRFEKGAIGSSEYQTDLKELQGELARVEKNISRLGRKTRNRAGLAAVLLAVFLLTPGWVSGADVNITETDAEQALMEAGLVIDEMAGLGLGTAYANHTLEEAKLLFGRGEYSLALATAKYVPVIKQKALVVYGMIDDVEMRMHEVSSGGYGISEVAGLFRQGMEEFEKEDYEEAEKLLTQAMDMLDAAEQEAALSKAAETGMLDSSAAWLISNSMAIIVSFALGLLGGGLMLIKTRKMRRGLKIKKLERETASIKDSMKSIQGNYFNKSGMSKKNYQARMESQKEALSSVMEELEAIKTGKK